MQFGDIASYFSRPICYILLSVKTFVFSLLLLSLNTSMWYCHPCMIVTKIYTPMLLFVIKTHTYFSRCRVLATTFFIRLVAVNFCDLFDSDSWWYIQFWKYDFAVKFRKVKKKCMSWSAQTAIFFRFIAVKLQTIDPHVWYYLLIYCLPSIYLHFCVISYLTEKNDFQNVISLSQYIYILYIF